MTPAHWIALAALVAVFPATAHAQVPDVPDGEGPASYADVAARVETAEPAAAVVALNAFAESHPTDPDAAEALWDVASLALDRLRDPPMALAALDRLLSRYPESRPAQRARRKLETLEALGVRAHPEVVAAYLALSDEPAALRDFLAKFPEFPEADVVRLRLLQADPSVTQTLVDPDRLLDDPATAWRTGRVLAEARFAAGEYASSLEAAEQVSDDAGAKRARRMLFAQRIAQACTLWVALTVLFLAARTSRAGLWRPVPTAVRYFLPVALAFLAMAYPMEETFRPAMYTLAFGGTGLLWVLSASPHRMSRPLRALAHSGTMLAFVYAVVFRFGLLPPLLETLKNGLQR